MQVIEFLYNYLLGHQEKENGMDWFVSIVRIAGASFPVASSLVQLQAEIDSKELLQRVSKLEDPISYLHELVPELSKGIYEAIKSTNSNKVEFDDIFYEKYSRPLAALESQGFIKGGHTLGKSFAAGLRLTDPSFIMYLCALAENKQKMESLINEVDDCPKGKWLNGKAIQESLGLPLPVIQAVFDIYEAKGYGLCSRTIGESQYMGKA